MTIAYLPPRHQSCALPRLHAPSAESLAGALEQAGCAVVEDAIGPGALARLRRELDPWFEHAACGEGAFFGRRTKRFSALFAKSPASADLALHSEILAAVEQVLHGAKTGADCIQISQTQAIEIGPGEPAQVLHRDDSVFPFVPAVEVIVNVMWPLDPFTPRNGATRLLPGSHTWPREGLEQYEDGVVDAVALPGSAIVWVGSLLHGGGHNRTDAPRRGVVMSYSVAWLAQAEKLLLSIPPDVARALPPKLQRLIGYQVHRPNLGWVEGRDPIDWLHGRTGPLAAVKDNLTPTQSEMLDAYLASVAE